MSVLHRIWALPTGKIAFFILGLVAFLAVFGPLVAPQDPLAAHPETLAGPSWQHWLGTDYLAGTCSAGCSTARAPASSARSRWP